MLEYIGGRFFSRSPCRPDGPLGELLGPCQCIAHVALTKPAGNTDRALTQPRPKNAEHFATRHGEARRPLLNNLLRKKATVEVAELKEPMHGRLGINGHGYSTRLPTATRGTFVAGSRSQGHGRRPRLRLWLPLDFHIKMGKMGMV